MRYRVLGGTGIEVSVHCLGTMMFGSVGNPDHDDCVRIIHAALDSGINFVDTADMYSAGESEEIVGKALRGRRDDVVLATKVHFPFTEGRNRERQLAPLDRLRGRAEPAPARHRLDRPLPGPPPRPHDRHRGDALRADRSATAGEDPRVRLLHVPGGGDRRGARRRGTARARPVPHRAAAVLASWPAASRAPCCRSASGTAWVCWSGARWRRGSSPAATARAARSTCRPAGRRIAPFRFDEAIPLNGREARRRRAARRGRGRGRLYAARAGARVHHRAPGGHVDHHRAAHDGTARGVAEGRRAGAGRRRAGPDRRDRAARHERLPARRRAWRPPVLVDPAMRRRPPEQRAAA